MEAFLQFPWFVQLVVVMGSLRLVFKPIFALVERYIADSPSKDDDAKLAAVKASPIYKALSFIVDLLLSVKLPQAPK